MAPLIPSMSSGGGGYAGIQNYRPPTYSFANAGPRGAAKAIRDRENTMMGRRSTILTGGLGLSEQPNVRVHSLLGS